MERGSAERERLPGPRSARDEPDRRAAAPAWPGRLWSWLSVPICSIDSPLQMFMHGVARFRGGSATRRGFRTQFRTRSSLSLRGRTAYRQLARPREARCHGTRDQRYPELAQPVDHRHQRGGTWRHV